MSVGRTAGVVAPPLFLLTWIVAGALDHNYSFLTGHGSDISLGSMGWLMALNFLVVGVLELVFAAGLLASRERILAILVLLVGLGLIASGAFPEDAPKAATSLSGSIHNAAFPVVFVSIVIGAAYSAIRGRGAGWRTYSAVTAGVLLALVLIFMIAGSEKGDPLFPITGLIQLGLVAIAFGWLSSRAWRLQRLATVATRPSDEVRPQPTSV